MCNLSLWVTSFQLEPHLIRICTRHLLYQITSTIDECQYQGYVEAPRPLCLPLHDGLRFRLLSIPSPSVRPARAVLFRVHFSQPPHESLNWSDLSKNTQGKNRCLQTHMNDAFFWCSEECSRMCQFPLDFNKSQYMLTQTIKIMIAVSAKHNKIMTTVHNTCV